MYHGIFQSDEDIKLRSFYKALQLNPKVRQPIFNAQFIGSIRTEQLAVPSSEGRELPVGLQSVESPEGPGLCERPSSGSHDHPQCETCPGVS